MKQEFNWRDYDNYNEWLHDVLETLTESIEEKGKEIERLNNIINELEKWVEIRLESCYQLEIDYNLNSKIEILEEIKRKIEELKGDSSNGNK